MKLKKRTNRRQADLSKKILIGCCVTLLMLLLGAAGLSALVLHGTIDANAIRYIAPAVLSLGTMVGALVAGRGMENKPLAVAGVGGAILFLLVTITILFFSGKFGNIILGLVAIAFGCVIGSCVNLPKHKGKYPRNR